MEALLTGTQVVDFEDTTFSLALEKLHGSPLAFIAQGAPIIGRGNRDARGTPLLMFCLLFGRFPRLLQQFLSFEEVTHGPTDFGRLLPLLCCGSTVAARL